MHIFILKCPQNGTFCIGSSRLSVILNFFLQKLPLLSTALYSTNKLARIHAMRSIKPNLRL